MINVVLKKTKRLLVQCVAVLFLLLGLIGLFLPFLQGILFILIGLILLSIYNPSIKERIEQILKKVPALRTPAEKVEQFVTRLIGTP